MTRLDLWSPGLLHVFTPLINQSTCLRSLNTELLSGTPPLRCQSLETLMISLAGSYFDDDCARREGDALRKAHFTRLRDITYAGSASLSGVGVATLVHALRDCPLHRLDLSDHRGPVAAQTVHDVLLQFTQLTGLHIRCRGLDPHRDLVSIFEHLARLSTRLVEVDLSSLSFNQSMHDAAGDAFVDLVAGAQTLVSLKIDAWDLSQDCTHRLPRWSTQHSADASVMGRFHVC